METEINNKNTLAEIYYKMEKKQKVSFRKRLAELFDWDSEKTFYRKIEKDYKPTIIEKLAAEMAYEEVTNPLIMNANEKHSLPSPDG